MLRACEADPLGAKTIVRERVVVAVVVEWRGKVALLKRSKAVQHEPGLWHCVTGYVEPGVSAQTQAFREVLEETGVRKSDILNSAAGPVLHLEDSRQQNWVIHTFLIRTAKRRLLLDWEHDTYRWTTRHQVKRFSNRAHWLDAVVAATASI